MRWFYLALATAAQTAASMIRLAIPALMPFIQAEFTLDRAQVGVVSSVLNAGAAVAGVPAGRLVDRVGERPVIGYATVASGLVVLAVHAAPGFVWLLVALFVAGFITTISVPAGGVLVSRWFSRAERGFAMGIRQTGVPMGGALGALILPPLAVATTWRTALDAAAVFAVVVGLLALWLYREAPVPAGTPRAAGSTGFLRLLARRDIGALTVYSFAFGGAQWCFLTYLVLYLTQTLGQSILLAGTLLGAAQLCGAAARVVWGIASDRLFGGRRTPMLLIVGLLAIVGSISLGFSSPQTPVWAIAATAALLGATLQGWNALPHVLAPELAGPRSAGLAVGLINSAGFTGVIVFPPIFGLLVDATASYRLAWLGLIVLLVAGMAALPLVHRAEHAAHAGDASPPVH